MPANIQRALRKNVAIFSVYLIDVFQYRLRSFVWLLVGSVNVVVLLLYWIASLQASGSTEFSIPGITSYYIVLLSLSTLVICHIEEDISQMDIYKGQLHSYLLRPYPYFLRKFHQEVVWRLLGGFWASLIVVAMLLFGVKFQITSQWQYVLLTILSVFLGMAVSFFMKVCLGLLAIWITQIRGLMDTMLILEIIFAGFIIPLHLFPMSIKNIALSLPFASTVYAPTALLTQTLSLGEVVQLLGFQVIWLTIFYVLAKSLFSRGVRHYTGVSQ